MLLLFFFFGNLFNLNNYYNYLVLNRRVRSKHDKPAYTVCMYAYIYNSVTIRKKPGLRELDFISIHIDDIYIGLDI